MSLFESIPSFLDAAWALTFGLIGDGTAIAGRAQGYTSTSATSAKLISNAQSNPQGTDGQRSVKSSNANDTAAGSGARTIRLTYLTAAYELKTEDITLNGVTDVDTVATDIAYMESMVVLTCGTAAGNNAGNITLHSNTSGSGTTIGSISAGDNRSMYAHHYVPAGQTCYILALNIGATVVAGQTYINVVQDPGATNPQIQQGQSVFHGAVNSFALEFKVPIKVEGPAYVTMWEKPIAVTASVAHGGFEYIQF